MFLDEIHEPADLRTLSQTQLTQLAAEIRARIVDVVTVNGGHLGSDLGVVELTLALHRVFDSPRDAIIWDTGHQAYPHKLLTGRQAAFDTLRQPGGLSGYPSREESVHDWVENCHASTSLSYAHGMATGFRLRGENDRRVVAVVGDGALTGGMAYEALNNLGHARCPVIIVLNDNGRSYAPTVSRLSSGVTYLRLNPSYVHARERLRLMLRNITGLGGLAYSSMHGLTSALREIVTPHRFFETLGVRYAGPIDGHDISGMERAFANAAEWHGPIVVHVLTQKGRGYAPAEDDEVQRLHDFKIQPTRIAQGDMNAPVSYTEAFTKAVLKEAKRRPELVAITAAMPGPTGLLPFQADFAARFFDVGIAEQHAVTAAAGMAMAGLRPVVAIYSTFFSRAFDQANLDVGLHGLPVVFVLDRAGMTGDDGPSHHARDGPVPRRALGDPVPEDAGSACRPRPRGKRPFGTARTARGRHGVPAGGGKARRGRRGGRSQARPRGHRSHRMGRASGLPARPRDARRRDWTRPGADDGGRDPRWWRRHVPRRRDAPVVLRRANPAPGACPRGPTQLHPSRQTRPDPGWARLGRTRDRGFGDRGSRDAEGPTPADLNRAHYRATAQQDGRKGRRRR